MIQDQLYSCYNLISIIQQKENYQNQVAERTPSINQRRSDRVVIAPSETWRWTARYHSLSEHSNSGFAEQEHESSLGEDLLAPANTPRICAMLTGFA
ncbi:hypothetical protein QL285_063360 [Trifolium repens]|nr:hypothetical protein QL285_063360 [Trifolium repens]